MGKGWRCLMGGVEADWIATDSKIFTATKIQGYHVEKNPSWTMERVAKSGAAGLRAALHASSCWTPARSKKKKATPQQLWGFYLYPMHNQTTTAAVTERTNGRCPDLEMHETTSCGGVEGEHRTHFPSILGSRSEEPSHGRPFVGEPHEMLQSEWYLAPALWGATCSTFLRGPAVQRAAVRVARTLSAQTLRHGHLPAPELPNTHVSCTRVDSSWGKEAGGVAG
ncbi:Hyaluronidase-2 [Bagarius yarrelli]|uniref:Hyaluronidase-2 n=1 Tax=Bagarius yarrelli TaxID=175774 RepID=A0A556VVC4_BAGYA|nr:Hyaluronidase-2 [Bagarius yarrelli]